MSPSNYYQVLYTKQFRKDLDRLKRSGKHSLINKVTNNKAPAMQ
ncbi:MAG: hypothetical protein ABIH58_02045 [Patescibacteria group bacterium]